MALEQISVVRLGLGEDLKRSETCDEVGDAVVNPLSLLNGKGPQSYVVSAVRLSVYRRVYHHSPRPVTNCLNALFGYCV